MLRIIKIVAVAATLFASAAAQAGFQYVDWKTTGDKQVLLHTNTGVEWLRLGNTNHQSLNTALSRNEGWRLPSYSELVYMLSSMYNLSEYNLSQSKSNQRRNNWQAGSSTFISLLGNGSKYKSHTRGLYLDDSGVVRFMGAYSNEGGAYINYYGLGSGNLNMDSVYSSGNIAGVFLVSDGGVSLASQLDPTMNINNANAPINNVPAPFALGAFALCLIGLSRYKKGILIKQ